MNIENLSEEELKDIILKKQLEWIKLCQDNFLFFAESVWQDFIYRKTKDPKKWGHHQIIAESFQEIADGDAKRLIINMPPRHTKSEFASYLFPAWYIGKYPKKKIMQVSHNAELASRFGSKVRNLMNTREYKEIFGNVTLREDSKAKGRYVGRPIMVGNILQRVLAVLSQDEGRTYLLSMTHILNKTQCLIQQWNVHMNGTIQDPDNVYNQVVEF
jgi:hypothetical protein